MLFITLTLSGQDRMYKVYIQPEGEERLDINSNSASILLNHHDGDQYFYHNTLNSSMFPQWLRNSSPSLAQLILANKKHPTSFFGRLSIDIIVISILPLLCAEDIICLRRVCLFRTISAPYLTRLTRSINCSSRLPMNVLSGKESSGE